MDGVEEFDCIDCGAAVTRFALRPGQPERCAGCVFLTWIEDPHSREEMRVYMLREGIIGDVLADHPTGIDRQHVPDAKP